MLLDLSGMQKQELVDRKFSEVAVQNDFLKSIYTSLLDERKNIKTENRVIRMVIDSKEIFYDPEIIPIITDIEDADISQNMGNMIILKNITRYEERDVAKTNLISTVSHEMKTPISSINLTLKLLEDSRIGGLNSEQKELIQAIRQQSNRLSKVVNEILNFSQIETGNIRLNFSVVHPEEIVDYATTALMIILSEKNIQLETEIEKELPTLSVDIEKTVWVLVNLLSNAIRYSKKGDKIILSIGRENERVYFSVQDFGSRYCNRRSEKTYLADLHRLEKDLKGGGDLDLLYLKNLCRRKVEILKFIVEKMKVVHSFFICLYNY